MKLKKRPAIIVTLQTVVVSLLESKAAAFAAGRVTQPK
jgi:hypothetical protein